MNGRAVQSRAEHQSSSSESGVRHVSRSAVFHWRTSHWHLTVSARSAERSRPLATDAATVLLLSCWCTDNERSRDATRRGGHFCCCSAPLQESSSSRRQMQFATSKLHLHILTNHAAVADRDHSSEGQHRAQHTTRREKRREEKRG